MKITKQINRKIISPLIYGLGLEQILAKNSSKDKMIINYHGVTDKFNLSINHRHLDVSQFEQDIIYYKKHYNIVSLEEIFNLYRNNTAVEKKTIALTFDDGYENNLKIALPILEKYQVPATFFIITAGLDNDEFITWYDALDMMRLASPNAHNYGELANKIKIMGAERDGYVESLIVKIANYSEVKNANKPYWKLVNTKQLLECSRSELIKIGSHTHLHYNVGNISKDLAVEELTISKNILENLLQKKIISIAYPDGNYNDFIKNEAEKLGYSNQLAVIYPNAREVQDTRVLCRWTMSNSTTHQANMILLATSFNKLGF